MAEKLTVARPYAEAAFKLAQERGTLAQWSGQLALLETVVGDERVAALIGDPKSSAAEIEALVLGVCGERLDGAGRNFVQVLAMNARLPLLGEIRRLFEARKAEHEGILEATIQSAFPLQEAERGRLVARLEAKYGRKVSAAVEIHPELLGGCRIVVGDSVFDASVRGHLDSMATALAR